MGGDQIEAPPPHEKLPSKSPSLLCSKVKMYPYRQIDKTLEDKCRKGTKKCVVIGSLMIIRSSCLTVKQYAGSKCCLRIKNTRLHGNLMM